MMKITAESKQIDRLRKKFPDLKIKRITTVDWEIYFDGHSEKEIIESFEEIKSLEIPKKEEIKMAENPQNPQNPQQPNLSKVTSDMSSAMGTLHSIILGEVGQRVNLLEVQIKNLQNIDEANKVQLIAEFNNFKKSIEKISEDTVRNLEKKLLEIAAKSDEFGRDQQEFKKKQQDKFLKMAEILKS